MKQTILKIISATALGLLAAFEVVVTAQSAIGSEKKVIASSFSSVEEALAITGVRLVFECRIKLDNLSDQEISSALQGLKIKMKSLEDPLVSLFAEKGKDKISQDCRTIDKNGLGLVILNAMAEYDIRLSKNEISKENIPEEQFFLAAGMLAGHQCRKAKGFYPSAKFGTDQLGKAMMNQGLPLSIMLNKNLINAGISLSSILNQSCDGFTDSKKAEDILLKFFMNQ